MYRYAKGGFKDALHHTYIITYTHALSIYQGNLQPFTVCRQLNGSSVNAPFAVIDIQPLYSFEGH